MKVARNIERRLEGMVEGFFAKVFRSGLQPVEVGRRILREMEEGRTVSVNRTYAPNEFRIVMGSEDHERFTGMEAQLQREFSELVIDQAKHDRWNLMGMPRISFVEDERMGKGEFRVDASLTADADGPRPNVSTRRPPEDDPSSTGAISLDTANRLGLATGAAELVVLDEDGRERERIALTRARIVIGRQSNNDVVLSDPNVSRRHAELRRNDEGWTLVDLGSTNGTTVNGHAGAEHRLSDGDKLGFGTSELVFKIRGRG
ncbi:MAG: DUF3662 and FHA domain-containing protein [Actinomycetota bacterium]|nr:DUF3662 and FHA domain-containing protein [Actinomycetota bacterium]